MADRRDPRRLASGMAPFQLATGVVPAEAVGVLGKGATAATAEADRILIAEHSGKYGAGFSRAMPDKPKDDDDGANRATRTNAESEHEKELSRR